MPVDVLVLPSYYPYPGRERAGSFFRDQAEALARAGACVGVAFVEPRSLRDLSWRALSESHWQTISQREEGVWTVRQKGWNIGLRTVSGSRVWASLLVRLVLRKLTGPLRPDVIHAHNALYAGLAARAIAKQLGIPYIVTEHSAALLMGTASPAAIGLARKVYADAHAVVAVSAALARAITPYAGGNPVRVIPNVVDADFFAPPPAPRGQSRFKVLAVGDLSPNKGFDVLIRAFAAQFRGAPEYELVIGGEGPAQSKLKALARECGIAGQATFPGELTRQQVREAMWSAHVLVISSYYETFGVVAIEAIATGMPVIATRCGGPEDVITPEIGWLVSPGDSREMAAALRQAQENRKDLSQNRDRLIEPYSMPSVAGKLITLYERAGSGKTTSIGSICA
ncbi:MAG: glycosyltransferase [Bryobacteraceae bacterium]|jgi:glycosyltransferase involved in cell wall biosynthesis